MKRRAFITLIGGAAAWPLGARAQQPATPVIGVLSGSSPTGRAHLVTAFRQGVREGGYTEGQNVAIEYRWAQDQYDRLPDLAADLVRSQVTVIAATDTASAMAAKAANTKIPIVFATGFDPVRGGLVASLNRPGSNVTGIYFIANDLGGKQLGLLHELSPGAVRIAVLVDPLWPVTEPLCLRRQGCGFGHWEANRSPLCQYRSRHRYGHCRPCAKAAGCAPGRSQRIGQQPSRTTCYAGGAS